MSNGSDQRPYVADALRSEYDSPGPRPSQRARTNVRGSRNEKPTRGTTESPFPRASSDSATCAPFPRRVTFSVAGSSNVRQKRHSAAMFQPRSLSVGARKNDGRNVLKSGSRSGPEGGSSTGASGRSATCSRAHSKPLGAHGVASARRKTNVQVWSAPALRGRGGSCTDSAVRGAKASRRGPPVSFTTPFSAYSQIISYRSRLTKKASLKRRKRPAGASAAVTRTSRCAYFTSAACGLGVRSAWKIPLQLKLSSLGVSPKSPP